MREALRFLGPHNSSNLFIVAHGKDLARAIKFRGETNLSLLFLYIEMGWENPIGYRQKGKDRREIKLYYIIGDDNGHRDRLEPVKIEDGWAGIRHFSPSEIFRFQFNVIKLICSDLITNRSFDYLEGKTSN